METPQILFLIIIVFIVAEFLFSKYLDYRDNQSWNSPIPNIVKGLYNKTKYNTAKQYHQEKGKVGLISGAISFVGLLAMLLLNGFAGLDNMVRQLTSNYILQTLLFFGILGLAQFIIGLPFNIYNTFVIEEKYGFNKTTAKTFVLDLFKGLALSVIIGGGLLALITFLFNQMGNHFWWIAWLVVTAFSVFMNMLYTSLIVPVFNQLTPLEDGELKQAIEAYARKVDFPLTNISVIDGSKRSSKANAYFSGLGKKKHIVLFDTLMKEHTTEEITAILAHEVGHYKKKHIMQSLIIGIIQTGIVFFVFGWLARFPFLKDTLNAGFNSFHLSLIVFSMLYSPISMLTGIGMNMLSRKNEYEADNFAKTTYNEKPLMDALKKLSVNHLSNLTPDKLNVFIGYSHPPLVQRLEAMVKK